MKQKRQREQPERRRPIVEPNLIGEAKVRSLPTPGGLREFLDRLLRRRR